MKILQDKLFPLACLLCAIPVLLPYYPAMVDVPQHAAQIAALKSLLTGGAWAFSDMFQLNLFTPYWLGYGLVMIIANLLGLVLAMKVVVASSLCLYVWAAARLCVRMNMPAEWRWGFLLLPFGFAYEWGFLNFIVAVPFGFLFLIKVLRVRERIETSWMIQVVIWVHFLFFAHFLVAAFFCAVAIFLLADPWKGVKAWVIRSLPVLSIIPVTCIWLIVSFNSSPEARGATVWLIGVNRLTDFLPALVSSPQPAIGQVVGLLFLVIPLLAGATPKRSIFAWAPFSLYVVWMLCVPHALGGNAFTYQRFGLLGLPLYFLCFEPANEKEKRYTQLIGIGLAIIAVSFIGWHSIRSLVFDAEVRGYQMVIEKAEPGKRMLMLAFNHASRSSGAPLHLHTAGWYQAESGGLVEFNFARFWGMPVRYKAGAPSEIYSSFEWSPATLDWQRHRGELFDYFLVRYPSDASEWLREKSGDNVRLIEKSGEWQLYGRK